MPDTAGPLVETHLDDPRRLALIARLDLHGHLSDPGLDAVITTLTEACSAPMAVVNVLTPNLQTLPAEHGVGASCTTVPDAVSFCAEVVASGRELTVGDAAAHPVYGENPLVVSGAVGSYAGVPLQHDGLVIGSVSVFDEVPREFTEGELRVLRAQGRLASAVVQLRALASWDALTGLATRPLLLERASAAVQRARRGGGQVAIAVLDVVGMGGINRAAGSAHGDVVLQVVAERLSAACGPTDSVARIGGDSFAVLFDAVASTEDAGARAAAVHTAVQGAVVAQGRTTELELRYGLHTGHGEDADTLLAGAERGSAASSVPAVAAGEPCEEAEELRQALRDGQLVLHYQPVIELTTDRMVGVEALVRWQHAERGLVPPLQFIELAESCGVIGEIGDWVLRTASAQAARWSEQGRPLDVAINLSPRQIASPGFADHVVAVLREVGAPLDRIVLEVTESALLDQPGASGTLAALQAQGIRLALDDFGTGYSSLSYLRRFPIDIIKIDRSFVSGLGVHPDDDAIVASVVSLARNTGKSVVAEGVETTEQLALLLDLGVESAQGFLWSEPLPADQVLGWWTALERSGPTSRAARVPDAASQTAPAPDSAEAMVLRMHAEGASLHTIAAALNGQGRRTGLGVRWHVRSVARVVSPAVPRRPAEPLLAVLGAVERDSPGVRRDSAADLRDEVADDRDRAAEQRDLEGSRRDRAASDRDAEGGRRDQAAERRDGAALARDADADARDRRAEARDAGAERHRATDGPDAGVQAQLRSRAAQQGAAADREQAQRDRQAGAGHRAESGLDREVALRDRGDGALDRGAAGRDRTTSWRDRGSGAEERVGAVDDRSTALADRGASATDREQASLDGLTGVYLRGAGYTELEREIWRARRTGQELVVAFLDVDHLKTVNDVQGHAAGDALLVRVARTLRQHLRPYDLVVRFGGDEFLCALAGMDVAEATRRFALVHADLASGPVPASVTVGTADLRTEDTAATLVARADAALYRQRERRFVAPS